MMSLTTNNYGIIFVGIITACIGFFVLSKKPKSRIHISFATFALGGALWVIGIGLLLLTKDFFFDRVINYGGLIFVLGFFQLAQAISVPMTFRISPYFLYAPVAIDILYIIPLSLVNSGMTISESGTVSPIPRPYIIPHSFLTLAFTFFGIAILVYKLKHSQGEDRLRIKYLFLGTSVFMSASVLFDAILPAFNICDFNLLGPLSAPIFVGIIAYAIVRHELLDIRIIIQRGLIYTCLVVTIIICYLGIINIIGLFLSKSSSITILITDAITTTIGIFGVPIVEKYFRKKTDKIFFKDTYNYAEALHKLSEVVYTSLTFNDLKKRIERTVSLILKCSEVKLDLITEKSKDKAHKHGGKKIKKPLPYMPTLCVPIRLDNDVIGSIYCGEKRSGDYYTPEDVRLLETFAYQAATSFGRARLYLEVKEYADTLETKVSERTEALKLAQENQRQMMIDISHNLQTPLTVFQTKIEKLKQNHPKDETILGFEKRIKDLSEFIYKLLELAKIESKDKAHNEERLDLSSLTKEIIEEIEIIAATRNITIRSSISSNIFIKGNPKDMREVLLNILSNSLKYMRRDGDKTIEINLIEKGENALLTIKDSGIGIDKENQSKIFERFFRANPGDSLGTGIGLAITKQIIMNHKGKIWFDSIPNIGTTFFIELPLS